MKWNVIGLAVLAMAAMIGRAGGQATERGKEPDLSTPEKAVGAYLDAIEAEDVKALRATMHATKPPYTRVVDDFAVLFTTTHRFHRIVTKLVPGENLFWDFGADKVVKEQREKLAKTTFRVEGNKATPVIDGQPQGRGGEPTLIKVGNQWQYEFDDLFPYENYPLNPRNRGGDTAAMMYLLTRYSPALDAVAADVEAGKLKTREDVEKAMHEKMGPIQEAVQKELTELQKKQGAAPEEK